jgi:superfamily II DNA or RNA helicase
LSDEDTIKLLNDLEIPDDIIRKLAEEERRNLKILLEIIKMANQDRKIIVFACSVEHAKLLSNILNFKGYPAAAITSSTPDSQRHKFVHMFRESQELNILTNYGVLTTGFDVPRANVAVITRPTKSVVLYSQMIGRVMRGPKVGGNERCSVIYVSDELPGANLSMAESFNFWEDIW